MTPLRNLALFARAPTPGKSKTRLIPRLGAQGACDFAEAALIDILHLMSEIEQSRRTLFYTPKDAGPGLQKMLQREALSDFWELQPQPDTEDLGGRLQAALEYLQTGNASVQAVTSSSPDLNAVATFIGMDCFDLTPDSVCQSMDLVSGSKSTAHIVDAMDGGYVLLTIPLACDGDRVFSNIAWSTDRTGQMQKQRLHEAGLKCDVGEALSDVDEPEDLDRLWETRVDWSAGFPLTTRFMQGVMET